MARRHLGNAAELDYIARSQGRGADALLSRSLRAELASRYPWEKRKAYFDHFRSRTGYKGEWSLLHPFDDLTSKEMGDIIDAVAEAKDGGLGNLNAREWGMLLHCGDRSFFAERLNDAKEKYKRKTPADFARE